jgi:hypothetical protein
MAHETSIVGDLINFRGLVYAPLNENGVIFLFGRVADDLHMYIEEIKPGFPDCVARRFTGRGWERVLIEFEFRSSNFVQHKHDANGCDILVCWEHDWADCPLEVIELSSAIPDMQNIPVQKPRTAIDGGSRGKHALQALFQTRRTSEAVQGWYRELEQALREWNSAIWTNIGEKVIGIYSPSRAFASISPQPNSLQVKCFSRGEPLPGTRVVNAKLAPRWAAFSVKQESQLPGAIAILKESHTRHMAALRAGESISRFSGGARRGGEAALETEEDGTE